MNFFHNTSDILQYAFGHEYSFFQNLCFKRILESLLVKHIPYQQAINYYSMLDQYPKTSRER